jgi:hypothetical protein
MFYFTRCQRERNRPMPIEFDAGIHAYEQRLPLESLQTTYERKGYVFARNRGRVTSRQDWMLVEEDYLYYREIDRDLAEQNQFGWMG